MGATTGLWLQRHAPPSQLLGTAHASYGPNTSHGVWPIAFFFSLNDLSSLENGNRIMKAVINILNALTQACVPWILEKPRSSRMWHLPEVVRLMRSKHAAFAVGDFCQYGTRWRKRTGYLCMHVSEARVQKLLGKRCSGSNGNCSRTGCKHMLLQGSGAGGKPLTLIAQPYPPRLASALSSTIIDDAK